MGAPDPTFSSLSPVEKNLVRLMQSIDRGRLQFLTVRDGQPSFEAPLTAVRLVKLRRGRSAEPRTVAAADSADFALRREVTDLLAQIRGIKFGMIQRLEVLHGLPTSMEIAEPLALPIPAGTSSTHTSAR